MTCRVVRLQVDWLDLNSRGDLLLFRGGTQIRPRQAGGQRSGQRGVTLHQLRMTHRVQPVTFVQQQIAALALVADALRNIGEEGNQRRLPRVRQDIGFGKVFTGEVRS